MARPVRVLLRVDVAPYDRRIRDEAEGGSKESQTLSRALDRTFAAVQRDFQHGEVVRKAQIPRLLAARYGLSNLYVEDLPGFHRLLYTVEGNDQEVVVLILAILDHREYDRLFGRAHS